MQEPFNWKRTIQIGNDCVNKYTLRIKTEQYENFNYWVRQEEGDGPFLASVGAQDLFKSSSKKADNWFRCMDKFY